MACKEPTLKAPPPAGIRGTPIIDDLRRPAPAGTLGRDMAIVVIRWEE